MSPCFFQNPSANSSTRTHFDYETIRKFLPITLNYGFLFVQNQPIFFGFYRISPCSTSSVLNGLDAGMDAHVAKPLDIATLGKVAPQGRKGVVSHKLPFVGNRPPFASCGRSFPKRGAFGECLPTKGESHFLHTHKRHPGFAMPGWRSLFYRYICAVSGVAMPSFSVMRRLISSSTYSSVGFSKSWLFWYSSMISPRICSRM